MKTLDELQVALDIISDGSDPELLEWAVIQLTGVVLPSRTAGVAAYREVLDCDNGYLRALMMKGRSFSAAARSSRPVSYTRRLGESLFHARGSMHKWSMSSGKMTSRSRGGNYIHSIFREE